jgi:hypothetical protein
LAAERGHSTTGPRNWETTATKNVPVSDPVIIALATDQDRPAIYQLRHVVYAQELRQHRENETGQLSDSLDAYNTYLVAKRGRELIGSSASRHRAERIPLTSTWRGKNYVFHVMVLFTKYVC